MFAFIGMSFLLANLTGWRSLAKQFRATSKVEGKSFWFVTATTTFAGGFRQCLFIKVNETGFGMSLLFPINMFFFPRLFIPWEHVRIFQERRWFFIWTYVTINFDTYPHVMEMMGRPGRAILEEYQRYYIKHQTTELTFK